MTRLWTQEERDRQSQLIRTWKPWRLAGVKTQEGKAISSKNATKHGYYSQEQIAQRKAIRALLRELKASLG